MDDKYILLLSLICFLAVVVALLILVIFYLLKQKRKAKAQNVTESSKVFQRQFHGKSDEADEEKGTGIPLLREDKDNKVIEKISLENEQRRKRKDNTKEVGSQTESKSLKTIGTLTEETLHPVQEIQKDNDKIIDFNPPKGNRNLGNTCFLILPYRPCILPNHSERQ